MKSNGVKALDIMLKDSAIISISTFGDKYRGFASKDGIIVSVIMGSIPGVFRKLLEKLNKEGKCIDA